MKYYFIFLSFLIPLFGQAGSTGTYQSLTGLPGIDKVQEGNFVQFINTLVQWTIAIAAALAVAMIVYGGLERMTKDSIQKHSDGTKRIQAAVWGLLIALSSYLMLATVNPNLVNLNLVVKDIQVTAEGKFEFIDANGEYIRGSSVQGTYTPTPTNASTTAGGTGMPGTHFPNQAWDQCAQQAIQNSSLPGSTPSDASKYFSSATPTTEDWTKLLGSMSQKESNFNPSLTYRESFTDNNGNNVISTGLLQLSQESSRGYGFSNMTTEQLKDPCTNIQVGVKILEKWVREDGCISCKSTSGVWRGGARYWAVLRK